MNYQGLVISRVYGSGYTVRRGDSMDYLTYLGGSDLPSIMYRVLGIWIRRWK